MATLNAIETAAYYRESTCRQNGIVLIYDGEAYGWKDKLRDASAERPGVIAVDQQGNIFEAQGGNDYDGAKHWVAI